MINFILNLQRLTNYQYFYFKKIKNILTNKKFDILEEKFDELIKTSDSKKSFTLFKK